jgi:glycosyltransferase involved in cell wall biosynthesis
LTDVITVVSEEELTEGSRILGRQAGLRLIENGVDCVAFSPAGSIASRTIDPLVVCVGRLSKAKGQDLLVDAVARMKTPNVRLRLVGDGEDHVELVERTVSHGLHHRVEFAGACDPRPHLRAADVVVIPSRSEGMSLVMLEAMACGAAVVTTDVNGVSALGGCGVVTPVCDVNALAAAVDRLLASPNERGELGRRARDRAVRSYQLSRPLAQYGETWHVAVGSVGRRP